MRAYLSATRLATKLQMLRSGKKSKTFVVVEGITDYRLYSKLFEAAVSEVIIGESKQNVLEAVVLCQKQKLEGIIGIIDADFEHMAPITKSYGVVFMTDGHDLEGMLIASEAYKQVMLEYGDLNKLGRFEQRRKKDVRTILLENVGLIGYLRKLSLEQHLEFSFNDLNFAEFTYVSDLEIKEDLLIKYLIFHSRKQADLSQEKVKTLLHQSMKSDDDLWQVCCGHDLMELLVIGFVHLFGNYNAKKIFSGQLEGCFRLAYQLDFFKTTQLYAQLKNWEKNQNKYQLFGHMDI